MVEFPDGDAGFFLLEADDTEREGDILHLPRRGDITVDNLRKVIGKGFESGLEDGRLVELARARDDRALRTTAKIGGNK